MNWSIGYSREADKFLVKHKDIEADLIDEVGKFIRKVNGETVSVNVRKLSGEWEGYYRIRKGKIRIIFYPDFHENEIYISVIDFRGDVYK